MQRLTLLDYPGKLACAVFTRGCNLRCPFCHNASLVLPHQFQTPEISLEDFFQFLSKRQGILDGICISGGEALLQPGIEDFIRRIRDMGFLVKLDTNGAFPERLRKLSEEGCLDYVAMDIKNSLEKYGQTVGISNFSTSAIEESVDFLLSGTQPFEFRTTVISEFHNAETFFQIGEWIRGDEHYYLQQFVDSGNLVGKFHLHPVDARGMSLFKEIVSAYVPNVELRGIQDITSKEGDALCTKSSNATENLSISISKKFAEQY
ncbi:MAG: anaerobic ribonucleoside-triphosphate reductase activating protein [Fibrobacter sp.]|nr:anaerobic ribonucleoside-triphosphate reductase activating protein [Fibrobacter sp.]